MAVLYGLALVIIGWTAGAEETPGWRESYGVPPADFVDVDAQNDDQYQWLYELLFNEQVRLSHPQESFKTFRVHLRDTYKYFPHPVFISRKYLSSEASAIEGKITYSGFFKKKYKYDLIRQPWGHWTLRVRIHFKQAKPNDLKLFAEKIHLAEMKWNREKINADFNYSFRFEIADSESDAHFSVSVLDDTRGPYDQFWSRNWTAATVAHELGHMLGLGDEYETLTGKRHCLLESLMCSSQSGRLLPHHYYFILRRLVRSDLIALNTK